VAQQEARKANPESAVGGAEEQKIKTTWSLSRVACDQRCISNVGQDGDVEYRSRGTANSVKLNRSRSPGLYGVWKLGHRKMSDI